MQYVCPACRRSYEAPGACPVDQTELVDAKAVSAQIKAAAAEPSKEDGRHGTLPLTRTPPVSKPVTLPTVKVVSALGDSVHDALGLLRKGPAGSEYDALLGQTLDGRYCIEKKIGEGGMGVVFSARHAVIERPLAIKVLKREVMRETATIQRFVQEAKAASRIGHPNIVDVTDFGTTPDGLTYAVMELVTGKTLGNTLRDEAPLPSLRAIKIAAQIARALGAAHDKGIVHRDLKPENVFLLDREGRTDFVKIVDFGIAKVTPAEGAEAGPRLTRAGSVFGTPEYMAPEQASGRGDTDSRVDIYALGIILYEMVCGRVPHRGDSTVRTLAMQMLDAIDPPSKVRPDAEIPPELEAVIMKALAKKREARYQTMGELLVALEKVHAVIGQSITGSPIYALTPTPPGADANVAAPVSTAAPTKRPRTPTNRARFEPEFVSSTEKPTFEHVFTETEVPVQRSRWPLLVLLVLVLGGVAGAVVLVARKGAGSDLPPDAALVQTPSDAATTPPDAAVVVEVVDAAEVIAQVDAGVRVRPPRRDAGVTAVVTRPDAAVVIPAGRMQVQVITKPETAQLFVGTSYRGPGGVTLEEPYGTRLTLRCRHKGYKDGTVEVVFDGNTEVALCVAKRIKICTDNIKNPFDDCELDPTKPVPNQIPDP